MVLTLPKALALPQVLTFPKTLTLPEALTAVYCMLSPQLLRHCDFERCVQIDTN
jgi:hypothetical protein